MHNCQILLTSDCYFSKLYTSILPSYNYCNNNNVVHIVFIMCMSMFVCDSKFDLFFVFSVSCYMYCIVCPFVLVTKILCRGGRSDVFG